MGGLLVALVMKYADNVVNNTISIIKVPLRFSHDGLSTKRTRAHTHRELIREWLFLGFHGRTPGCAGNEIRRQRRQGLRHLPLDRPLLGRLALHPLLPLLAHPHLRRRLLAGHRRHHPLLHHPPRRTLGKYRGGWERSEPAPCRAAAARRDIRGRSSGP